MADNQLQHADSVAPPEVEFDLCGRQKLAPGFAHYVECDHGCGYLIGVGDAWASASHRSCWEAWVRRHSDGPVLPSEYEGRCPKCGVALDPEGHHLYATECAHNDGPECGSAGAVDSTGPHSAGDVR